MIKNFVVKVKQVKYQERGLINFLNYLEDKKRHNDSIIKIKDFNKNFFFKNTIMTITEHNLTKKHGRKSTNYADSFIYTIPSSYKEKGMKNLEEITKKLIDDIYTQFNSQLAEDKKIEKKDFLKQIFINIHNDKKHIHFNVVFPRTFKNKGEFIANRITNMKKFLYNTKKQWTYNLTKNLNVNIEDYKTKTNFKKGYKNQYFKDLINENNETLEKIKEKEKEITSLNELIKLQRRNLRKELNDIIKENDRKKEIIDNFALLMRYYKSFNKSILNKQITTILSNYKSIKEKINNLKNIEIKNKQIKKIISEIEKNSNNEIKNYSDDSTFSM